jgi:hypothetical protein
MDGSFGRGSPSQQQQGRRTREVDSPQQAWSPGSPQQQQQYDAQQQWQQQQQQQQQYGAQQQRQLQQQQWDALQSQPLAGDEYGGGVKVAAHGTTLVDGFAHSWLCCPNSST